jgi:group I intron endonuclease
MYGVIYKITNLINGKFYIGQTIMTLSKRWSKHKSDANRGAGWVLSAAIRKYGADAFVIEVIEKHNSRDDLNSAEINAIATLKPVYNACAGGSGLGSPTEDVRKKISASSKGRKLSQETKNKISQANIGRKQSQETLNKIQDSLQPRYDAMRQARLEKYGTLKRIRDNRLYLSPNQKLFEEAGVKGKNEKIALLAKIGYESGKRMRLVGDLNPMYGVPKPVDIKQKLSQDNSGAGNPFYGSSHSEESRAKMRAAHALRPPVICPQCKKSGQINAMKRWHFENCRGF